MPSENKAATAPGTDNLGLFYLWHLEAIRLIDAEALDKHSLAGGGGAEVRVAIIDNGAATTHPNLPKDRFRRRMDFANWPHGAIYPGRGTTDLTAGGKNPTSKKDVLKQIAKLGGYDEGELEDIKSIGKNLETEFHDLLADLEIDRPPHAPAPWPLPCPLPFENPALLVGVEDPSARFSAHGTACAGLVGAETRDEAKKIKSGGRGNPHVLPYRGVDPDARIIPVNTVYSHEYWTLISALLFARLAGADVILLPRAVEDMAEPVPPADCDTPEDGEPDAREDPRYSRFLVDRARYQRKKLFEKLLAEISAEVPVVVAAGNEGRGPLGYPARLGVAEEEGGQATAPDLIVVGAATAYGTISSYAAGRRRPDQPQSDDVFIYAPSDDRPDLTTEEFRIDELQWSGRKLPLPDRPDGLPEYCPYKVLSIDIPGPYGYSREPNDVGDLEEPGSGVKTGSADYQQNQPKSLYTLFGGTSAASAIVAGTISLMIRAHRTARGDGGARMPVDDIRDILRGTAQPFQDLRQPPDKRPQHGDGAQFLNAGKAVAKAG